MLKEWSIKTWMNALRSRGGFLLSEDPRSYRNLVASTVTTTPDQSAIAFPKNDPA